MQVLDNSLLEFVHEASVMQMGSFNYSKNYVVGVCIAHLTPMVGTMRVLYTEIGCFVKQCGYHQRRRNKRKEKK